MKFQCVDCLVASLNQGAALGGSGTSSGNLIDDFRSAKMRSGLR